MNCHSLVKLFDASCWPTTCGGKKVRRPSMFKITQQHTNNWEAGKLLLQCTVFPTVDVPPPEYGQIYNILSNDNQYDITIGNFPGCSCVYFVKMLATFLGARGCMCNANMSITSCRQLCFMGSQKSSFITTHGAGMKFNYC
jgi:hypothetical protein